MFDFIITFLDAHYWTVSYVLTYTLGTICGITLITRFVRMFPTYIKTGSMGDSHLGIFHYNSEYNHIKGLDYIKVKLHGFFTATHLETIIFDTLACAGIITALHLAWFLLLIAGLIIGTIFGIVGFVVYLRNQHVKKEEFHSALRGD